jgi:hypothetical protein
MALQCQIFSVQYGGILFLVLFYTCYLLDQTPYESVAHMRLEVFNEIILMISL